jgi:small-conductance mechanosensitive channel
VDGDFDYSQLSRAQLEEALTRIDRGRYPINYQRILRELEVRSQESPTGQSVQPQPSVLNLIAWYSIGLVSAYVVAYFCAGFVVAAVLAVLGLKGVFEPKLMPPLIGTLIAIAAPLVLYLRLVRTQPGKFLRVASGVAIIASFLCAALSYIFADAQTPRPATVFFATVTLNFTIGSLVGTLYGTRQLKPPSNNRWRGP